MKDYLLGLAYCFVIAAAFVFARWATRPKKRKHRPDWVPDGWEYSSGKWDTDAKDNHKD